MKFRASFAASLVAISILISPSASAATNICIAYDTGGLGDRSYNDATLAGVKLAQNQYTFTFEGVVTDVNRFIYRAVIASSQCQRGQDQKCR